MITDRRIQARANLRTPLVLLRGGCAEPIGTETENVSVEGFFCYVNILLSPGERLHFLLELPPWPSDTCDSAVVYIQGTAEVMRVCARDSLVALGVGCHVKNYRVLKVSETFARESVLSDFLDACRNRADL